MVQGMQTSKNLRKSLPSSLSICRVLIPGAPGIARSKEAQVQELQMRTADYISSQRTAKRGLRPVGVRNPGPLPSWSNPKASSGHGAAHSGAEPHTWPL